MDISAGDISEVIFRRIIPNESDQFPIDGKMLSVLVEVDGKQSVRRISEKTGIEIGALRDVIAKFIQLKIIEPTSSARPILDREFYDYLNLQMCLAVGPIAEVLIEEAVAALGHPMTQFPMHQVAELVDLLAKDIRREDKEIRFKQNMIHKIKESGLKIT